MADVKLIGDLERVVLIRKWDIPGQGTSFPAFNVLPLFEPRTKQDKLVAVQLRKVIVSKSPPGSDEIKHRIEVMCEASNSLWVKKEPSRITKCLTLIPNEVAKMLGTPLNEFRAITDLIERVNKLTAESLHTQLVSKFTEKIVESPNLATGWFDAMFFHSGKEPKKWSLIAEVADRSAFAYPANHQRVQDWMNQQFQANAEKEPTSKRSPKSSVSPMLTDAYAGNAKGRLDKFPSVALPILVRVILRSMHKDSQCQYRYGVIESQSFPVGHDARQEMKDALEWLGNSEREGRTWADARGMCGYTTRNGKKRPIGGLLFAYPAQLSADVPELCGLIAGLESGVDPDGSRFQECAARVIGALSLNQGESSDTEIRVFALKTMDKARTKLLQSRTITASHLVESATAWQHAARNIPLIFIRQFVENKGNKPFWIEPSIPYPAGVVTCLNTAWERSGTHAEPIPGFEIGDALGLLLESGIVLNAIVTRAIRAIVTNSLSFVLALVHAHHRGRVHDAKKSRNQGMKQALLLPSIVGLLLAKLGRWKGDYMKGPPFLVGRMLSLADQLHVEYCLDERKGQIPTQLFGSALMPTALEQPEQAMALLCQRIPPYKNWATRLQSGERVGLVKFLLGEMGRISNQLNECGVPKTADDADKAEMLLGYLASTEKTKENDNSNPPSLEGISHE